MLSPEDVESIADNFARRKVGLRMSSYLIAGACALIGAAFGAFTTAKFENLAMKQDIADLTIKAEQIRSQISNASWQSQRLWDEKKLAYVAIIKAIDRISSQSIELQLHAHGLSVTDKLPPRAMEAANELMKASASFSEAAALASIFLGVTATNAIDHYRAAGRELQTADASGLAPDALPAIRRNAQELRAKIVMAAKEELGQELAIAPLVAP